MTILPISKEDAFQIRNEFFYSNKKQGYQLKSKAYRLLASHDKHPLRKWVYQISDSLHFDMIGGIILIEERDDLDYK